MTDLFYEELLRSKKIKVTSTLAEVERATILRVLEDQNWNQTATARILEIGIRTIQMKIKKYRSQGYVVPSHQQNRVDL